MLNHYCKKFSQTKSSFLSAATFSNSEATRLLGSLPLYSAAVYLTLSLLLLAGCGQRGDLYLAEEAPSNTDFIIYKGNKTADVKAEQAIQEHKIAEAAVEAPQDY